MPGIPYPTTTNTYEAGSYTYGFTSNDRVYTNNIANTWFGTGDGDDFVTATGWNLAIDLGAGNDVVEICNQTTVYGGAGADYFVFDGAKYYNAGYTWDAGYTWSWIQDFTDGVDKIAILNGTAGVLGFANLTLTQSGADVIISFPQNAPNIVLQNTSLGAIDASDLIFGDGTGGGTGSGGSIPYPTPTSTFEAATDSDGTAGNDRVFTNGIANTWISTGDGDDYLTNTSWNLNIDLGAGNDVIEIYNTSTTVTGGSGNDYFVIDGAQYVGPGWDWVSTTTLATITDFTNGQDKIAILNGTAGVLDFSNLTLTQSGADVIITFPQNAPRIVVQNTALSSLDASDFIFGTGQGGGGGTGSTITGTVAAETLTGTANADTITGLGGNDTMNGGDGNDTFQVGGTGDGFDSIDGGAGSDTIVATAANTTIGLAALSNVETVSSGGFSGVTISGTGNADTLNFSGVTLSGIGSINAGSGDDSVTGSNGADTMIGALGNDTLNGGGGDDTLNGGAGTNNLIGGSGTDTAQYSGTRSQYTVTQNANGTYALSGNGSTDTLDSVESVQFSDGTYSTSSLVAQPPGTILVSSVAELRAAIHNPAYSTILIAPGSYTVDTHDPATTWGEAGFFIDRDVTIRSAGPGRADFHAGFDIGKGIFVTQEGGTASVTFDGIGFFDTRINFGGQGGSANYAGVRFQSLSSETLTVLNCHFENNFNALKSGSDSGGLFIDNSTFLHNGNLNGSGQEHQIYWEGTYVHVEDSLFNDSGFGHTIKTVVSQYTELYRNNITDGADGASLVNVTGGGALTLIDNVFNKITTARSGNVFEYETMRAGGMPGAILIDNNTINSSFQDVVDGSYATLIRNETDSIAVISNNTITGNYNDAWLMGDTQFTNNTINGVLSADQSWRANADQLTALADTVFLTGTSGNVIGTSWVLQATNAGDGNDTLVASPDYDGRDIFYGGLGDDVLAGGQGDDILFGDDGNDTLWAGPSYYATFFGDRLHGGAGADYLGVGPLAQGQTAFVSMDGGSGDDTLDGRTATGTLMFGGAGNDIILGSQTSIDGAWDAFNGGDGDDIVYAGLGYSNYTYGGNGIDTLVYAGSYVNDFDVTWDYNTILAVYSKTQAGADELGGYYERPGGFEYIQFSDGVYDVAARTFTAGQVRVSLSSLLATPVPSYPGQAQPLTLTGTSAAETLNGGAAGDTITGLGGDDTLNGNDGNDLFRVTGAADGFDTVNGGAGTDTIAATANNAVIGLTALSGVETITSGGFTGVTIAGSTAANTLDFTSVTLSGIVRIDGGAGNDSISGSGGNDTIRGSAGDDTINAGGGNDTIEFTGTASGFDAVNGGAGTDTISALANSTVIGLSALSGVEAITAGTFTGVLVRGSGNADTLDFSNVTLTNITRIEGGAGNDVLTGNSAANTIWGGTNNDTVNGGAGNDSLLGDAGNDTLIGGAGNDTLNGGADIDTVDYSANTVNQTISLATTAAQTISSGDVDTISNVENVIGGSGNDTITGSTAANTLNGGVGNDRLTGGAGNDTIIGGTGTLDVAVFAGTQATYSITTLNGVVSVKDNATTTDGNDGTDTINGIEKVEFKGGVQVGVTSPIILDLDGRGVSTLTAAQSHARFDLDGDGHGDDVSWIGSTEGFLFLDRDGNGTLSGANEMAFNTDVADAASDLVGLRSFDSNGDGVLDAQDERFASFKVWQDVDGDGSVDGGEVMTLSQAGVAAINLAASAVNASTALGDVAVVNRGSYVRTDGTVMDYADAALTYFAGSAAGGGRGQGHGLRGTNPFDFAESQVGDGGMVQALQTAISSGKGLAVGMESLGKGWTISGATATKGGVDVMEGPDKLTAELPGLPGAVDAAGGERHGLLAPGLEIEPLGLLSFEAQHDLRPDWVFGW